MPKSQINDICERGSSKHHAIVALREKLDIGYLNKW